MLNFEVIKCLRLLLDPYITPLNKTFLLVLKNFTNRVVWSGMEILRGDC